MSQNCCIHESQPCTLLGDRLETEISPRAAMCPSVRAPSHVRFIGVTWGAAGLSSLRNFERFVLYQNRPCLLLTRSRSRLTIGRCNAKFDWHGMRLVRISRIIMSLIRCRINYVNQWLSHLFSDFLSYFTKVFQSLSINTQLAALSIAFWVRGCTKHFRDGWTAEKEA